MLLHNQALWHAAIAFVFAPLLILECLSMTAEVCDLAAQAFLYWADIAAYVQTRGNVCGDADGIDLVGAALDEMMRQT